MSTKRRPAGRRGQRTAVLLLAILAVSAVAFAYPAFARHEDVLAATWQEPWYLVGLALCPLVLWRGTLGEDRRTPRLRIGTVAPLLAAPAGFRALLRDVPGVIRTGAIAMLVLAIARPVSTITPESSDEEGIDAVVVLDLSGSMQAVLDNLPPELDRDRGSRPRAERPTRLDAAKAVIRDFISRRKTDRVGVVVFGKAAYVVSPPTLDYQLLDTLVAKMELRLIDGSATAIGEGLGVAVARLRRSQAKSKAIILLTDGDNNSGSISPEYATHLATLMGAKVYTIQIGEGDLAQVLDGTDLFGNPRYVTVPFPTNPRLLAQIASETGGDTYVATDARALQASFHSVLDDLEKTKFEARIATFEDLFGLFLLPGVLLLGLDALARALFLRRFP